jgi:hypothetical protein
MNPKRKEKVTKKKIMFVPVIEQNGCKKKGVDKNTHLIWLVPKKMSSSWPGIDWSPILNDDKAPLLLFQQQQY